MKKHYIKVYWDSEWKELSGMMDEVMDEDDLPEYQSTYAQDLAYRFGGDEDRKQVYLISGKVFFNIGCELTFDEVLIGDPEDDSTWIHLHDVEFKSPSTGYKLLEEISNDNHYYIPVYLDGYKEGKGGKAGYLLLELGL